MSLNYLLDSSAWLEYFNATNKGEEVKKIVEEVKVATSIITIAELSDIFSRSNKDFSAFLSFIEAKSIIIPLSLPIAVHAGKIKTEMRKKCSNFGLADGVLLSTAMQIKATIVTKDNHFRNCENVLFLK